MKRTLMFLVIFMSSYVSAQTTEQLRKKEYASAHSILGKDFITPEEVMKVRPSMVYTENQIRTLMVNLPSFNTLVWFKDNGYAIMPSPPRDMSMLEIRRLSTDTFRRKEAEWYSHQSFYSEDKTAFGWLAIRKTTIPNSINKSWKEQCELLSTRESVPNVATLSWFITTYFKVRKIRLFFSTRSRTSSLDSDGNHVIIAGLPDGIYVNYWYDPVRSDDVGLSTLITGTATPVATTLVFKH